MELINRAKRYYGPPCELKAHEPEWDLKASYQSDIKDRTHQFFVRQQRIQRSNIVKAEAGHSYRLCYFGERQLPQWVNEANIRAHKIQRQ